MVRDPQFWRRFSVAVHRDEEAQAEALSRPELKHAYVQTLSPISSSTSTHSPTIQQQQPWPVPTTTQPISPTSQTSFSPSPITKTTTPLSPRQPSVLRKPPATHKKRQRTLQPLYNSCQNRSTLTLGLTGRPPSRFKFWTSISASADPRNRESWLEEQRRKKSKRTCMCWCFWLVFATLVTGLVITGVILKREGII